MKIIKNKEDQIIFGVEIEESLMNAIRRYVNEIPILAIDEVEIFRNDSAMYDETLAHRIGLIPLQMEKSFNDKNEVKLKLSSKKAGYVFSGELKGLIRIAHDKIPLVILNKDQELELIAKVKVGKGIEHSKYSPGMIVYRNFFSVKPNKECNIELLKQSCPKGVFKVEGNKLKISQEACDMCEECINACKENKKGDIEIIPEKELLITVESFGQITPKEIVLNSIKELKKDLESFSKQVK
ncbi:MAG: DNA-directed RNA polymerase subunit D [Nanoarchaeota archaeon]